MRATAVVGEMLSGLVNAEGGVSSLHPAEHSVLGNTNWLIVAVASLLGLLAVGGAAGRVARQLARRSTPELNVLLNRSAAFYGRWPEDELASVPHGELVAEAARCRRIIELLERRTAAGIARGPAVCGPIDGLQAWIALLSKRIDGRDGASSGTVYA